MKNSKQRPKGISRLLQLSGESKTPLYIGFALSTLGTIVQLTPFLAVYQVMAELLRHVATGKIVNSNFMIRWAFYGLVGLLIGYLLSYIGGMMSHTFSYRAVCGVRIKVAEHIGKLPMGYMNNNAVGKIKQVLDVDVEQMEAFLAHQLPDLLSTIVMLIVLFIIMFTLNVWLAFACLIPIVVGFACQLFTMIKIMKSGGIKENFDALENISSSSLQYVKGMPSIKIFGQTVKSFRKFYNDIISYRDFTTKMTEIIRPGYVRFRVLVLSIATFIVPVGLLIYLHTPENLSFVVTFIFFLILAPGVSAPTLKLRSFSEGMNTINESISRVETILNEDILQEPKCGQNPASYNIVFQNVTFSYSADKQILHNVSFTAQQGEITALVGPSGAGKSTIAELIPRFWDVSNGEISIGGVNIKNIATQELMNLMSFVFQESFLFTDTIYNNIALGKPNATRQEVEQAAKAAQCHDFIMALPDRYNTMIGDGGVHLSGGEQQRISIARAILKNAPILILDEATAASDAENEYKIQQALHELIKNKTVIMIAHRLTTICNANQILVVSDGVILEKGTHTELLEIGGLYASMWNASVSSATWKIDTRKETALS